ncbi:hypothetical protein [Streptomyces sp. G44]|uniref:hypothetical protein n=1 Tax=Streptomyces sp. G44 TaxID=2807632 RepID=UPI001EF96B06|nr:hypothetical protein [Streptomyces sp. G44]
MCVDKKLSGVTAVRTLSCLNRTTASLVEVMHSKAIRSTSFTMADYFFTEVPAINAIIIALADAFYEAAADQRVEAT